MNLKTIFHMQFSLKIGTRNTISKWGNEHSFRGQAVSDVFCRSYFSFFAIIMLTFGSLGKFKVSIFIVE